MVTDELWEKIECDLLWNVDPLLLHHQEKAYDRGQT